MLERVGNGAVTSDPPCMTTPVGWPSAVKKSPFTPATVSDPDTAVSSAVSLSSPTTAPFERFVRSVYSPPGRGAVRTCRTTGPCGVNVSARSYVTPGTSVTGVCAVAGAAMTSRKRSRAPAGTSFRTGDNGSRSSAEPRGSPRPPEEGQWAMAVEIRPVAPADEAGALALVGALLPGMEEAFRRCAARAPELALVAADGVEVVGVCFAEVPHAGEGVV